MTSADRPAVVVRAHPHAANPARDAAAWALTNPWAIFIASSAMVSTFEGNKAETKTMLPVIESFARAGV